MTPKEAITFDPYLKWLGIRSTERPPNHYDLLGISVFESDADVIAAAAERQMAHVRKYQNGPHSAISQKLLNQLAGAKVCLLREEQKAAYDKALAARLAAPTQMSRESVWGKRHVVSVAAVAFGLVVLAAAWWGVSHRTQTDRTDPELDTLVAMGEADVPSSSVEGDITASADGEQVEVVDGPPAVDETDVAATAPEPPWDRPDGFQPVSRPTRQSAGGALQQALFDRRFGEALKADQALRKAANTTAERENADRLHLWFLSFERFWAAVDEALFDPQLRGSHLNFRDQTVTVAAVTDTEITLQASGGQTKQFTTDRKKMSIHLAIALARRQLGETSPKADVIMGVVLMTDRQGDLQTAKTLLQRAATQGEPIESLLRPEDIYASRSDGEATGQIDREITGSESDVAARSDGPASEDEPPSPSSTAALEPVDNASSSPGEPPPPQDIAVTDEGGPDEPSDSDDEQGETPAKHAVPSELEQEVEREKLKELFAAEYARENPADQLALGRKLLNHANRTTDDPAAKYVLYEEALALGLEGRSPQLSAQAVDALEHNFEIDAWQMRLDLVTAATKRVREPSGQLLMLNLCRRAISNFMAENDFEAAEPFVTTVQRISRASKEPSFKVYAKEIKSDFDAARRWYNKVRTSYASLEESADRPAANQAIGEYVCYGRGDFEAGLPFLAKGTDPETKSLAEQELSDETPGVDMAEAWWELSRRLKGPKAAAVRRHAVVLYSQALPRLSGITFENAERRILEDPSSLVTGYATLADLNGTQWSVQWPGREEWKSVRFNPGGDVVIQGAGPTWHGRAHDIDGSVRFLSRDNQSLYLVVRFGDQMLWQEFEVATGYLKSVGLGSSDPGARRRSS